MVRGGGGLSLRARTREKIKPLPSLASATASITAETLPSLFTAALPPLLAVLYGYVSRGGPVLAVACRTAIIASFLAGGLAVFLLFGLYPARFEYGRSLQAAGFLFEANQVGAWPYGGSPVTPVSVSSALAAATAAALATNASITGAAAPIGAAVEAADPVIAAFNPPVWRGDALLQEVTSGPGGSDISGGWLAGGAGGNLKHAVPTAFATAMLAWSLITFPDAHRAAGTGGRTANAVRVGADWLMKASGGLAGNSTPTALVFQVGNYTADKVRDGERDGERETEERGCRVEVGGGRWSVRAAHAFLFLFSSSSNHTPPLPTSSPPLPLSHSTQAYWGRPEDITGPRPALTAPLAGGPGLEIGGPGGSGDLAGSFAGALAAASVALKAADPTYATRLRSRAAVLQEVGEANPGLYRAALFSNTTTDDEASAIGPLFPLTTAQDKLLWGSAWLFRATGDARYLKKASEAFARFLYQEGAGNAPGAPPRAPALTPDQLFWGANVALAESAGWATFHERARAFLRSNICAEGERVRYTPLGRSFNVDAPPLGAAAATAFAAAAYARAARSSGAGLGAPTPSDARLATRYECFALSQVRYMLGGEAGGGGSSFVVGAGRGGGPTHAAHQGASCPPTPAECDAVTAQLTPAPNPWTVYGALVEGPGFSDSLPDVRPLNGSRVSLENQAGWAAALAAVSTPRLGKWETCLQGMGVVSRDRLVCG